MALGRKIKLLLVGLVVLGALVAVALWLSRSHMKRYVTGVHQRSVARSIAEWGAEYAAITNDASAVTAAEMVGYIGHYYVPGPGYRGPADIEAALEHQRVESIRRLVDSLQRYTGLDYGTNTQRWLDWAESRKNSESGGRE